jgi:hypothetical protein
MELAQLVDLAFSIPQTGLSNVGYIVEMAIGRF